MDTSALKSRSPLTRAYPFRLFQILIAITFAIYLISFIQVVSQLNELGTVMTTARKLLVVARWILGFGLIVLVWCALYTSFLARLVGLWRGLRGSLSRLGRINLVLFTLVVAAYPVIISGPYYTKIPNLFFRLLIFWFLALAGAEFLKAYRPQRKWGLWLLLSMVTICSLYLLLGYAKTIQNIPVSLAWSESSQIYFASTFLSRFIYGFWTPLPVIQPGYELLMTIPYLFQGLPIWVHRLWLVLLWVGFTVGLVQVLIRYLKISDGLIKLLFGVWAFLFLLNIPIYFHLIPCAFLVLFGFASQKRYGLWVGLTAASVWAGFTRINWLPLPGVLAAVLFILENPMQNRGWRYFIRPAVLITAGTAAAVASYLVYILGSRNPWYYFFSTYTSPLLWYRLLPSSTNSVGVLYEVLLYALPMLGAAAFFLRKQKGGWHWARLSALGLALVVYFLGGLLVSAKIGGGNNMHNLDAFFVLLLVIASAFVFGRFREDRTAEHPLHLPSGFVALAAGLPVFFVLIGVFFFFQAPQPDPKSSLAALQDFINVYAQPGENNILFISERQLLPLGMVKGVSLVPEYEKWFLMEMAMAGNERFYADFDRDIQNHRFRLIVSEPLHQLQRGKVDSFGEENDVWVRRVSQTILDNYDPVITLDGAALELYQPKIK